MVVLFKYAAKSDTLGDVKHAKYFDSPEAYAKIV